METAGAALRHEKSEEPRPSLFS